MSDAEKKKVIEKRPYTTPKLVEYGTVSELTEAKSPGASDGTPGSHHDVGA
jgi:hypothetical protein